MKYLKTLLVSIAILITTSSFTGKVNNVFVCDSKTSLAYHSINNCKGLNRCTHKIIEITKKEATDTYKKRACKICY